MESKLPLISICGVAFLIDVVKEEFRQYEQEDNCISFGQLMLKSGAYMMLFNKKVGNVWTGSRLAYPHYVERVTIPQMCQLDPFRLSQKYNKPLSAFMHLGSDKQWLSALSVESELNYLRQID